MEAIPFNILAVAGSNPAGEIPIVFFFFFFCCFAVQQLFPSPFEQRQQKRTRRFRDEVLDLLRGVRQPAGVNFGRVERDARQICFNLLNNKIR